MAGNAERLKPAENCTPRDWGGLVNTALLGFDSRWGRHQSRRYLAGTERGSGL